MNVLLYRVLWGLGLTPWEHRHAWAEQVSAMLDREERGRQPPFAERTVISFSRVSRVVDELARRGMVERVPDADDRRAVIVRLTPSRTLCLTDGPVRADCRFQGAEKLRGTTCEVTNLCGRGVPA